MFLSLALRNIQRNRKNTAIVILFIAVITFIFFAGNSVIGKAGKSIREAYIESLTGDVILEKSSVTSMNLFGANTPVIDSYFTVPPLPAYGVVFEMVKNNEAIAGITSQVSGRAYMNLLSVNDTVLICGVDAGSYFSLFPGITVEEGRALQQGEYGAMITLDRKERIEKKSNLNVEIGMPLLFTSGGTAGFKIREVPLVGIFSYANPGPLMNDIVIMDPQTVRVLNSIQVAGGEDIALGDNITRLFSEDIDDIFGESFAFSGTETEEGFSADTLQLFLSDSANLEIDTGTGGDWNFIIIKLKEGFSAGKFISEMNNMLSPYGIEAVNWRTAAGSSAIMMLLVQVLFNAGVFLVSIAGVIAAINVLLISVFRRTREIGTLRAIGSCDAQIRSLILSENIIIAIIAGLLGLVCGFLFFWMVNSLNLRIDNNLLSSLLGGQVLRLDIMPNVAILSFFAAVVLGFAASLYPVEAALRIEPMAAVRRG